MDIFVEVKKGDFSLAITLSRQRKIRSKVDEVKQILLKFQICDRTGLFIGGGLP